MEIGANLNGALREVTAAARALRDITDKLGSLTGSPKAAGGNGAGAANAFGSGAPAAGAPADALVADGPSTMTLSPAQRRIIERVLNTFETGRPEGRYDAIAIFPDGPNRIRQITYGKTQTTEYGNLRQLIEMYAGAGGQLSAELRPYVELIGRTPLVDDERFKQLLRQAGSDPVMQRTQDAFFDRAYFQPALAWAERHGFTKALSMLVIYDSWIHSGRIRDDIRARFPERPPAFGGNEETWIAQYVAARHDWLTNHGNPVVRPSNYRTRDLMREVARANWDLAQLPILANGTPVDAGRGAFGAAEDALPMLPPADDNAPYLVPYLGTDGVYVGGAPPAAGSHDGAEDGAVWSEAEPPEGVAAGPGRRVGLTADGAAALAARILRHPNIALATIHPSGRVDEATARRNIEDTAAGRPAQRSSYEGAPGGVAVLDPRMLAGMLALADRASFLVTEIAGGRHSPNSRHYAGLGFDVGIINGRNVAASHPDVAAFRARCRELGATEVLGPGDRYHSTHIHAAWPR